MSRAWFFDQFPDFDHDPQGRVSEEFKRLAAHGKWKPQGKTWKRQWNLCVGDNWDHLIGHRSNYLETWQAMCYKLELSGDFSSITKCRKALSRVYVNIVDVIECWVTNETPRKFHNSHKLMEYSKREEKIVNRNIAKQDRVLRVLLKKLF
ncbi:hypothetical protein N7492_001512 [Penicillium capsulatum]|uniref:Uncharacterized protein n=1 Tax=Penicillium capsulatum TaxID=69766 RepID=A0A9W9LZH6_9EURO|nr:hypothetical protein N7492_001512 [Penicillium capsulatum]KAJ6129435.1 hypothetical protein N7512_002215 [Penicillium capsulatum]